MNAQQLKNSILQEAISGRLVPQDPNDEPASKMLDIIRKEKTRLVKEKKITLSKPEKACIIKEDGDFSLPQNWEWGMINDVCRVFGRIGFRGYTKNDLRYSQENAAISISPSNMVNGTMDYSNCTYISEEKYEESPEIKIQNGDILIVKTGSSYGKTSLVENLQWKSTINPQIAVVKDIKINKKFIFYFFQSPYAQSNFKDFVLGTSIPTFSQLNLISMQIPLPPLAEQKRIVAKIEELMPKVEEYGKAQEALDKLNSELPERLKKSILQEAISGRLVPQDAADEPASALLQRIRQEKAQLVKQGKLKKKDLEETPISDEEKPFDIPDSWEWVRMGELLSNQTGLSYNKGDLEKKVENPIRVLRGGNIQNGSWTIKPDDVMIAPEFVKKQNLSLLKNTFITPAVTSLEHLGKTALITEDHPNIVAGGFVLYLIPYYKEDTIAKYLLYYFQTALYNKFCISIANKSGQAFWNISRQKLMNHTLPLPPLAEQKRIVAKIEELFAQIELLKQ